MQTKYVSRRVIVFSFIVNASDSQEQPHDLITGSRQAVNDKKFLQLVNGQRA